MSDPSKLSYTDAELSLPGSPRQVVRNAAAAVVQAIVSGVTLFLIFRLLLKALGPDALGIWSIVLTAASLGRLSDLGVSAGIVRFVAKYLGQQDAPAAVEIIESGTLFLGGALGLLLMISAPLLQFGLLAILPPDARPEAQELLPLALFSLWFSMIGTVMLSAIDGCNRADIRSMLVGLSGLVQLFLTWLLIAEYGLIGAAVAQIVGAGTIVVFGWAVLRTLLPTLPAIPRRLSLGRLREMVHYGLGFQAIALAGIVFDVTTKTLLIRVATLTTVGFYEMASRMVTQLRALLIAGNQVLVPMIARLQETAPDRLTDVYRRSYRILMYIAVPYFGGILALVPSVSVLWIGYANETFITFASLLTIAWFANTLNAPAHFANLGTGRLRWNLVSSASIGLLNVLAGAIFGYFYGGVGVVLGWCLALAVGSAVLSLSYHRMNRIPLSELLPAEHRSLLAFCVVGIAVVIPFTGWMLPRIGIALAAVGGTLLFLTIMSVPMWSHPLRGWFVNRLASHFAQVT